MTDELREYRCGALGTLKALGFMVPLVLIVIGWVWVDRKKFRFTG